MKKTITLLLALACTVSVSAESLKILSCGDGIPGLDDPQLYGLGISPDGHYVCGAVENGNGIFVADAMTGEVKWALADGDEGGELRHIDNNGVAVGFTESGIKFDFATAAQVSSPIPEGSKYVLCEDITADGSLIVGSIAGKSFTTTAAYMKEGGEWVTLPFPSEEELGPLAKKITVSSAAKNVSADGKIILGYLGSFTVPVLWIMNDEGEYEVDFFPLRFLKFTEEDIENEELPLYSISGMYFNMSDNGKYVSLLGLIKDKTTGEFFNSPAIYNTENRDITVYDRQEIDGSGDGLYPTAICDDGTFIGTLGQPYFGEVGCFIMEAGETKAYTYNDSFPIFEEELGESDRLGFNIPTAMSADGRYIMGYTYYCSDYYDSSANAYYVTYIIDRNGDASVENISENTTSAVVESIYSIDGHRRDNVVKGINLIRMSDGTTRKIMVK